MAYHLRAPRENLGVIHWQRDDRPFVTSAPLVIHDECWNRLAELPDFNPAGNVRAQVSRNFDKRNAFASVAGPGFALCWSPVYSLNHETAPPCYACGRSVVGRG